MAGLMEGTKYVYAVGGAGLIAHYDGNDWQQQTSGTNEELFGIGGSGPQDVYAVGANGVVLHSTGNGVWKHVNLPAVGTAYLRVWCSSSTDVYVVGEPGILHGHP